MNPASNFKTRSFPLDLVRCIAILSVFGIHFFLNSGYYSVAVAGSSWAAGMVLRTAFGVCVPLFMLLTGYLMRNKRPEATYFRRIGRIVAASVLAGIACLVYQHVTEGPLGAGQWIVKLLGFTAVPYGWYVRMYLGLFFLAPFINLGLNAMDKRQRYMLIVVLLCIVCLPDTVNGLMNGFFDIESDVLPAWWSGLYPVLYYTLGAHLRDFPPTISVKRGILLLALAIVLFSALNYAMEHGSKFSWNSVMGWSGIEDVLDSTLLFAVLIQLRWQPPRLIAVTTTALSRHSFGMYLTSWIADQVTYSVLATLIPTVRLRLFALPLCVIAVAAMSFVMSWVIEVLMRVGARLAKQLRSLANSIGNKFPRRTRPQ